MVRFELQNQNKVIQLRKLEKEMHLFQDAIVEELLKLLITVIDAELLEAVDCEKFCKNMHRHCT